MRNVNNFSTYKVYLAGGGFILTMRNVNICILTAEGGSQTGFILTMRNVNGEMEGIINAMQTVLY